MSKGRPFDLGRFDSRNKYLVLKIGTNNWSYSKQVGVNVCCNGLCGYNVQK